MSSFERMCLTCGLKAASEEPVSADKAGLALEPLGMKAVGRESGAVGFWGMEGWTPSTASQCAVVR